MIAEITSHQVWMVYYVADQVRSRDIGLDFRVPSMYQIAGSSRRLNVLLASRAFRTKERPIFWEDRNYPTASE